MVNLKIDKIDVSVPEGTTVMEAAASVGIKIPSLCYLKISMKLRPVEFAWWS